MKIVFKIYLVILCFVLLSFKIDEDSKFETKTFNNAKEYNGNGNGGIGQGNGNGPAVPIGSGMWILIVGSGLYLGNKIHNEIKN